jgi:hypothetical protein
MTLTALIALAAAQTAAPAAEMPADNKILVLTERLRSIRGSPGVTIRKGVVTPGACKIKRSSGDAEVDALACGAVALCATRSQPSRKAFNTCIDAEAIDAIVGLRGERAARNAELIEAEETGE